MSGGYVGRGNGGQPSNDQWVVSNGEEMPETVAGETGSHNIGKNRHYIFAHLSTRGHASGGHARMRTEVAIELSMHAGPRRRHTL